VDAKRAGSALRCSCIESLESRRLLAGLSIAAENQLPGNPASEWDISHAGDSSIQGFANDISINQGQTITFKIDDPNLAPYHLDIYRMGYYGGNGARKVATIPSAQTQRIDQPAPITNSATGLVDCGNWLPSASWVAQDPVSHVPATSGIYFAKVVREDTGGASHIYFIVRNDGDHSKILYKTSDTTWQAYNDWGGRSIEQPYNAAYKASYNRPFNTRAVDDGDGSFNFVFHAEYPMVRWLEANGYDVSYFTGVDAERLGSRIRDHQVFLSVGHDEYWSGPERTYVEAARDAGVNLAFFSGDEIYRKIRWENSIDGTNTPYRTMVCYNETNAGARIDPMDPPIWTGIWRDPRFSPPADGGKPENALSGTLFTVNEGPSLLGMSLRVPYSNSRFRFWRNTSVANLSSGQTATLGDHVLGYEWDEDLDNGFRPAGLIDMSLTSTAVNLRLTGDNINIGVDEFYPGTATHSLTLYRAASGALVFGAGTVQWSWGLDGQHDNGTSVTSPVMQQATVNLFADMNVQPATLQAGLVAASASTDRTATTSLITSPTSGSTVPQGVALTITGTATDAGGGVVGGVEVSVDGGTTWHPATGRASWTYAWTPPFGGTTNIRSRAADDSANLETPSAGVTITVQGTPQPTGTTIWSNTVVPTIVADPDAVPIELGVKFRSDVAGFITGLKFYKSSTNTGTHVGHLWTNSGQLLATATFTNETGSGWQWVSVASPVAISANTTYVASYHTNVGHYSANSYYFTSSADNAPLHALSDGADGGNGVYVYGSSAFPTNTYHSCNYWVDVVFNSGQDTTPPSVTAQSPAPGSSNVSTGTAVAATFSEAVQPATISFTLTGPSGSVAGSVSYAGSTRTATFTPSAALANSTTYTARVSGAQDLAGNAMTVAVTWSFTTIAPPDTTPPTVVAQSPAPGATGVAVGTNVTAKFSEAVQAATISFTLTGPSGSVAGSVSYASSTQMATFTPSVALANSTTYTARVSGAQDLAGNIMSAPVTWTFTTAAAPQTSSIWSDSVTPDVVADSDAVPIELGVKFRSDVAGSITGLRFYKSTTNTGTHIGHLWTGAGQLLATATFTNESASGWQTVTLGTPAAISANTTYVASYHTDTGHYSSNTDYFASSFDNPPLHALADGADGGNGVYVYGGSAFPTNSYHACNYWVDVTFNPASTGGSTWSQTTAADFNAGSQSGTLVTNSSGGEIQLAPAMHDDFAGTALGSGWTTSTWTSGQGTASISVSGGILSIGRNQVLSVLTSSTAAAEGRVSFGAAANQSFGVATDLAAQAGNYWAIFSTRTTTNTLYAQVNVSNSVTNTSLGTRPSGFHLYRVEPVSGGYRFLIDGVVKATISKAFPSGTQLKAVLSAQRGEPSPLLQADWARLALYPSSGTFTSAVFDAARVATWGAINWTATLPPGASLVLETSSGNTATPDGSWSPWSAVSNGGLIASPAAQYLRFRVRLLTNDVTVTPILLDIALFWS